VSTQQQVPDPFGPGEKAKMDYQAQLDRQKADHQYRLKKWELGLDRGVFGVLVAAVTALGVLWATTRADRERAGQAGQLEAARQAEARALEKYKLDESRQRFFLEKRMDALLAVATAMSDVTGVYFSYTGDRKGEPADRAERDYRKALDGAREAINRAEILFGADFGTAADRYFEVHRALMRAGVQDCGGYEDFVSDLSTAFDRLCLTALQDQDAEAAGRLKDAMPLADVPFAERRRLPPRAYLDKHFEHWKAARARRP
jgi:hypothetical protein